MVITIHTNTYQYKHLTLLMCERDGSGGGAFLPRSSSRTICCTCSTATACVCTKIGREEVGAHILMHLLLVSKFRLTQSVSPLQSGQCGVCLASATAQVESV